MSVARATEITTYRGTLKGAFVPAD